jgi:hypothetical protein
MTTSLSQQINSLVKTLEAGQYNVAPSQLTQGSALQTEDLQAVMHNVTFDDSHIKLQKMFSVKSSKSMLAQFNRQLSYGRFGGSAQREGAVGDVDVGDYIRSTVPMCFYSTVRRVTLAADMVNTIDGKSGSDREAENAALKIASDIEFDAFGGKANFSNAGLFDANPNAMPELPSMLGVDCQVRQSDFLLNTHDLMFDSYGSDQSVVISKNGPLEQTVIEDVSLRSRMNMGKAEQLIVDPVILTGYNKAVALATPGAGGASMQRIVLAGSAQDASGADLRRQWVSNGTISLEDSRFLSGKTSPRRPTVGSPGSPSATFTVGIAGTGALAAASSYTYFVTAENERGEGTKSAAIVTTAVLSTGSVTLTITPPAAAGITHFNVYRGSTASTTKFIGSVVNSGAATTVFSDLGNKAPGFVTGYLIQKDTWGFHELASYQRVKLAISDLSTPEAHLRFLTLAGYEPRKNVLIDNLF